MTTLKQAENNLGFHSNDTELLIEALYREGHTKLAEYIRNLSDDTLKTMYDDKCYECECLENTIDDLHDQNDELTDQLTDTQDALKILDEELTELRQEYDNLRFKNN